MAKNFSGLAARRMTVRGVEVRPLNFADVSRLWNTDAQALIDTFDTISKAEGGNISDMDAMRLTKVLIQHAPALGKEIFLAAIDDDGKPVEVGGVDDEGKPRTMTAGEVWERLMGVAEQTEMLTAIISMTVAESDNLKKTLQQLFPAVTGKAQAKVQAALTTQ